MLPQARTIMPYEPHGAESYRMPPCRVLAIAAVLACAWFIAPAPRAQQTEAEYQVERHAGVGQTVRLAGHVNYHFCESVIPTTIHVVTAPSHGTLAVRDEIVTSKHPELGRGDRCKHSSGQGKVVYYTRTSSGPDYFRYDSKSDNGVVHIDVTVD